MTKSSLVSAKNGCLLVLATLSMSFTAFGDDSVTDEFVANGETQSAENSQGELQSEDSLASEYGATADFLRDCRRHPHLCRTRPYPDFDGYVCYARSRGNGAIYTGFDRNSRWDARREALETCRDYSVASCYIADCDRY